MNFVCFNTRLSHDLIVAVSTLLSWRLSYNQ